jgi:uncharacterized protein (DUF1778 family)
MGVIDREQRKERLEARLTTEQKRHIEQAAQIRGTSVSDFVILSADEAAIRTIREQEVLTLNERARHVFAEALLNPPTPGRKLLAAARRYRKQAEAGEHVAPGRSTDGQRVLVEAMKYLAQSDSVGNRSAIELLSDHVRTRFPFAPPW